MSPCADHVTRIFRAAGTVYRLTLFVVRSASLVSLFAMLKSNDDSQTKEKQKK